MTIMDYIIIYIYDYDGHMMDYIYYDGLCMALIS